MLEEVWRREGTAHETKHTTPYVMHGGGSVMAGVCMAPNATDHWRLLMVKLLIDGAE